MKVVVKGSLPGNVLWYGEWGLWGAVISAEGSELQHVEPGTQLNEDAFAWEDCPCCGGIRSVCFHEKDSASASILYKKYAKAFPWEVATSP